MVNRYAGEIHINPVRILRGDDFNNDGHIKNIEDTLEEAIALNEAINHRLKGIKAWLEKGNAAAGIQFQFADGGYISVKGLSDEQLQQLATKGLIELFDYARDRDWVKKYGMQFGLVWEGGQAIEI
jgi:maltose-binding protein MalE